MTLLGLVLGLLVGLTLGVLGGGGSILTLPIFVYVVGFQKVPALAMSLAVVGTTSLVGALSHWRRGNVDVRTATRFGLLAMSGGVVGSWLGNRIEGGDIQMAGFGAVMLVSAFFMFRGRTEAGGDEPHESRSLLKILLPAIGVGILTGFLGVGGGFLFVPALVLLGGLDMKRAVGTSLLVIAMTSAVSFMVYLAGGVQVEWLFMALFTAAAVAGILTGASLVPHIPQVALRKAFAVFLVLMAVFILYENRAVFLGS